MGEAFAVELPTGEEAELGISAEGVVLGSERIGFDEIHRIHVGDAAAELVVEMDGGSTIVVKSSAAEQICESIRARLASSQPTPSVYRKGLLQPREMLRVLSENGWPRYLDVEYKFRSGDEIPVDLVGKDEADSVLKMKLEETGGGDLVVRFRDSLVSYRAGELWALPSLDSLTGDCLVFRRKIAVESDDDGPSKFLVVMTTLAVTRTSLANPVRGKPPDCHSLLETRQYMVGTEIVACTRRVYTRQSFFGKDIPDRIEGVEAVAPADAVGLLHEYMRQVWSEVLATGTMAAAASAALKSADLSAAAAETVPHWLIELAAQRRYSVRKSRQGGRSALQLVVEEQAEGTAEWEVVETMAATTGCPEFWLSGALPSETGDALILSRDGWQLHMCHLQSAGVISLELRIEAADVAEPVSVQWEEPVIGAVEGISASGKAGLMRSASQSQEFSDHLISSRWAEYLERKRMFKSGDEIPDEMACGGDAKKCIMTGLALGMTVPVPGFALIGGLGGAVVAAPPVQKAVARYIGNSLAHRIVVCEAGFGDFLLSCEYNHVGDSWKQDEVYSYKAGEFELLPCTDSLNGEELHIVHRCEAQGGVLVVHDYHSVERLGRGINVRQEVYDGDKMVCSSQRYYEYQEGSVMKREVLQPFVPSEALVATQFQWVETNVDEWLTAHQDEVLVEAKLLAIKAQENEELMGHGEALAAMAEAAVVKTAAFEEAKRKHESLGANQQINVADMLTLGTQMAGEVAVDVSSMDDSARKQAIIRARRATLQVTEMLAQSEGIQKLVQESDEQMSEHNVMSELAARAQVDPQAAKLLARGEQIAAEVATREINTPEDALAILDENEAFVDELTDLALRYIEDTVCSVEVPTVTGEKDWGTYSISGLAIKRFSIDRESVEATVTEAIRIEVHGIEIEFDAFNFELEKTSFPAVEDEGKAEATAEISACVQFGISTDEEKNICISDVEAHVRVDKLPVNVISANHRWLFNTLLSFFSNRVTDAVQEEVVEQVEKGVEFLDKQLGAALTSILESFASKGDELIEAAGATVDVSAFLILFGHRMCLTYVHGLFVSSPFCAQMALLAGCYLAGDRAKVARANAISHSFGGSATVIGRQSACAGRRGDTLEI